jgi:nucleotide-binding universal stress UspA family protein
MPPSIRSILHPTDFSPHSYEAYAHALRLALATKSKLYVVHVLETEVGEGWEPPQMRLSRLLVQWGLIEKTHPIGAIEQKLGIEIENFAFRRGDTPADEIVHFLNRHACDLVMLATHGREGLDRWLNGSVAETMFRRTTTPTLFLTHGARGFVDQVTGKMNLRHVLVPIDHSPLPFRAVEAANEFPRLVTGTEPTVQLLHVGPKAPHIKGPALVTIRYGNVVQTIIDSAVEYDVDLICMPTAGHHGVLDALRGSTTERVLRNAARPLLAISTA